MLDETIRVHAAAGRNLKIVTDETNRRALLSGGNYNDGTIRRTERARHYS